MNSFTVEKRTSLKLTKCYALNTSEGSYRATPWIRAFGDPLVRARKAGV